MRVPVPDDILPVEELGAVHFVGIGGAGLSAIARIMLARGVRVSGSDGAPSPVLDALAAVGARVHVGHATEQVGDADTLVVSTAVREDNPEVVAAYERGLRVLPRSAGLAAVMADRRVLAVAGTHGKTTTTSLLTTALVAAGADPSYAVGGELAQTGTNAHDGSSDLFVAEADESDGAFLVYTPHVAVVTNVEADHLDVWGSEAAYRAAFDEFLGRIEPGGLLVACVDDPGAAALLATARERGIRAVGVGESADADLRVEDVRFAGTRSTFTLVPADGGSHAVRGPVGPVELRIPGRHYVLDAALALTTGLLLGHDADALAEGLASFTGTRRRMEAKGEVAGVRVYDSYAHHPVEIAGDLQAARSVAGEGRVVVAFQPHLVSRTRIFGTAMGEALGAADEVVVTDVYLAREEADPDVTGGLVAGAVPLPAGAVALVPALGDVAAELVRRARPGDVVLTLGAGSITTVGPQVLDLLRAGATPGSA
ncbi:UDP-N-acetylmuramate--L-alanine ligase [Nocardioides sp. ChNu-99]|uniref:UDP-N-acetylmuramate--L-alanine ligase n=1 Tax=Nocardioides sp. ChNu-99 TaxID=2839897 RepID=UPI002406C16D|nr:UDP-N-acetylmuramate--L-alanine ligase [Nocardioides sp. ChNu-99]MDF9716558.1 UDP-N-acetylmuramate--L-alanine ligase [Nocardioides sp. ChNu-99]